MSNTNPSSIYARSNRLFVEESIKNFENSVNAKTEVYTDPFEEERSAMMENHINSENASNRYISFVQTVKTTLLTECLYKLLNESSGDATRNDILSCNIMRSIVSQYVTENGYTNILNKMKRASTATSIMYNVITETADKIIESVDKSNPDTFTVSPEMKDEFFKQLDYSDFEAISDAINQRVADATTEFIASNNRDREDINSALQDAQEKIDAVPEENTELRESYNMMANRKTNAIRNRSKGVLHSMVTAVCENVMKNKESNSEFLNEDGSMNISKIVDRTKIMYTFMEMLNTSRIDKVDSAFIESMIKDLAE